MIKFTYHGEAVGKGRPRTVRRGGRTITYTPEKTRAFEEAIRFEFLAANCEKMPVYKRDQALKATIIVGVSVPQSYPRRRRAMCLEGVLVPSKKPDVDNIIKAVLDPLNGYAFEDDAQVVQIYAEKFYTEDPFVEVTIDEL